MHALTYHTQTLLDDFLESTSDRHDFAYRLHAGTDFAADTGKLRQVPTGDFTNQVVQLRSYVSRIRCSHLANLVERIAQRNLGSHKCQRIAGSLGCECGRAGQTGIHLNHAIIVCLGVEGVLYVTFAHDAQVTDALGRKFLKHLHLFVAQRAGGSHHDGLTGVDAQRVEVLHACHGETVVVGIADYLELDFFPTFQGFFYQDLLGKGERAFGKFNEGFFVRADTATQSAQGVSGAHHYRITDFAGSRQRIFHAFYGVALRSFHRNFVELLHKEVAVFGVHDGFYRSTQHAHAVFLQDAVQVEFGTAVQSCLSAECQQDAVGLFFLDDFFYEIGSHRQEINFIGNAFRCLDSSNVRVHQNGTDTFFAQSLQCLRTGVVKFSGLTDLERT